MGWPDGRPALHQSVTSASSQERFARPLFLATIVTGSFLLFLTQPMIGRMALPRLGGAPAVWNSAMLVYQALLLGGYAYAHGIARLPPRRQAGLHLALFGAAALWLPIGLSSALPPANFAPALWVPWFLIASIGPLFFIISAQAPLMQRWYALETSRGDPYPLYAASNLGSFAGLISYPLIVEPLLSLEQQSRLWTAGFILLLALVIGCALTVPRHAATADVGERSPSPSRRRVLHWIALAAVPSGLMLSTTTHLTTDIVAMPLLWALPLGLYLLSFSVAFAARRGPADLVSAVAPFVILGAGAFAFASGTQRPIFAATLGLGLLFVVAVTLHAQMYRLRPEVDRLTGFYLAMSLGGVVGGVFCALAAPILLDWAYEHPLLIVAAAVLIPAQSYIPAIDRLWSDPLWGERLTLGFPVLALLLSLAGIDGFGLPDAVAYGASGIIALLALLSLGRRWVFAACLAALMLSYGGWDTLRLTVSDVRTRSYFGVYTVGSVEDGHATMLTHGTTLHGIQSRIPGAELAPTTYYVPGSGVAHVLSAAPELFGADADIGIVGLGTGTLACYAEPGQRWRFFEIDPAVVRIATESGYFTYVENCAPQADIVLGDARLTLEGLEPGTLDILAVDAFSSDSVPIHLLTREAFQVYARALQPRGILLVHISNRYLDLEPVLAAAALRGGWEAALLDYRPEDDAKDYATASVWVAMAKDPEVLGRMMVSSGSNGRWRDLESQRGFAGWSDDYASILPLIEGWTE